MDYIKLSEVTLLETVDTEPNVLAEVDGEVVRIPASEVSAPQVKADWDEEDPNSPAYILNKPEIPEGSGGGVKVVCYTPESAGLFDTETGDMVTAQELVNEWNSGTIIRIGVPEDSSAVMTVYYAVASNGKDILYAGIRYFKGSGLIEKEIS